MKDFIVQFFLGSSIKIIDEIADNPSLHIFQDYLKPLFVITAFLYGIGASNDFYYNLLWLAWFFSAYFGQSMDNQVDNGFWKICFGFVIFALVSSFTIPLTQIYLPIFIPFFLLLGTGNIIENILLPEEIIMSKLLFTFTVVLFLPIFYMYVLHPIVVEKKEYDFRFLEKHISLIIGYFITRLVFKVYLLFYG